ncbi:MAG: FAD-dependent oxidoreductase [Longimicrobiales bacterium]|nr:FAD-dependent oxidoreductase [Longimicrobiales bacterium]
MGGGEQTLTGPDFSEGYPRSDLREGEPVLGHMDGEPVLLTLVDGEITAVGASCTHYGGPLGDGLMVDGTVRCPWHHACFSLRTGEAVGAPALNPLPTWEVEVRDGRVIIGSKHEPSSLSSRGRRADGPERVVIVGAGAAGSAAAEALRREGHQGSITLVDPDPDAPYDRPNLSKDYLAGEAPEEWIPLRPDDFYPDHDIERVVDRAVGLDRERGVVELASGTSVSYDALLLATGATPRTLDVPGADASHVHTLRSLADCREIIDDAESGERAVVVGASFIGMEVAASLRGRGLDVTVVAPEDVPFERVLGTELGTLLKEKHEEHGVSFRLGRTLSRIGESQVVLDDGTEVEADLVVVGVGVRPDTRLAESAGLTVDDGVRVDENLRTDDPRIWVAGDAARFPDARTGAPVRIEHWVVAQRQGQTAARNILGHADPFDDVPFFWTVQFGVGVSYVGHATSWDRVDAEGSDDEGRAFRYYEDGRLTALATVGRDRLSLEIEVEMEEGSTA